MWVFWPSGSVKTNPKSVCEHARETSFPHPELRQYWQVYTLYLKIFFLWPTFSVWPFKDPFYWRVSALMPHLTGFLVSANHPSNFQGNRGLLLWVYYYLFMVRCFVTGRIFNGSSVPYFWKHKSFISFVILCCFPLRKYEKFSTLTGLSNSFSCVWRHVVTLLHYSMLMGPKVKAI